MSTNVRAAARYVGQKVHRKEDARLLAGSGRYVADVQRVGTLHAAFLRSEAASAGLARVDVSAAKELAGVVAVFTWADFHGKTGEAWHGMLGEQLVVPPPLAITDVRYVGDPIALVVAESRAIAEDACDLIEVDYERRPAVVDYRTASADTDHVVHAGWGLASNAMVAVPFMALSPDLEQAFTDAAHVVSCTIEQNRYVAVPMETRGVLATFDKGREELDLVAATQSVHETRSFFARYLDLPEANITVTARDVGGGFGQKMFMAREECAIVLAARELGATIRWIEDRRENLIGAGHSRNEQAEVRLAIDADGIIQAMSAATRADVGAYPICPGVVDPTLLPGPYRIGRFGFSMEMCWTNTMGKAAYRGPWMFETTAREMALDCAARQIGMDPIELRRRNLLSESELPHTTPTGQTFVEAAPLESLEQAAAMLDVAAFRREQAAARAEGRLLGLGVCCYIEPSSMNGPSLHSEAATVRVEPSGKVVAFLSTTSHGQSIETTMAQVVAEHLGVAYDDVTVLQADTKAAPWGPGTGGSRTAVIAGGAARAATLEVRDKVLAIAAQMMEAAPEDLEIVEREVSVKGTPARSIPLRDVAKKAYLNSNELPGQMGSLEATVRFKPERYPTWSNATHLCVVEIDPDTFVPTVLRYVVSEDCGEMINPQVVDGQIFGGVVQGLGGVLYEDMRYDDDGNPLTTTFLDYLLPTTAEVPAIEVGHVGRAATSNPGGYKGMGEGGAIGAHAAVANAVGDALAHLGVNVTSTPLGPEEIFRLVTAATATPEARTS